MNYCFESTSRYFSRRLATPSHKKEKRLDEKEAVEVICRLCPYQGNDPCAILVDETHIKLVPPASASRSGLPTVI